MAASVPAISAGGYHSLALRGDGTVVTWGRNLSGESDVPSDLSGVIAVAAGGYHSLALKSDGTLVAWGHYAYQQANVPAGLTGVTSVSGGGDHSLALKSDGTVVAWGYDSDGQTIVPTDLSGVIAVAAGGYHSLALKSDGTVVAWGNNVLHQTEVPAGLSGVIAIAAGRFHSLALKSDGTVVAWGYNNFWQSNVPTGLTGVIAIAAGESHSVALKSDGSVVSWGDNTYGQACNLPGFLGTVAIAAGSFHSLMLSSEGVVGYCGPTNSIDPDFGQARTQDMHSLHVIEIAAGKGHVTALHADGSLVAWGDNALGQLTLPQLNDPAEVFKTYVKQVAAGLNHSLALKAEGKVVAWGDNTNGAVTVPSGALADVKAVSAGEYCSVALKSDGTVIAWGTNDYGQLDIPSGLSGVKAISASATHVLALKADGTIAAWGDNSQGESDIPAELSAGGAISVSAGNFISSAVKNDGTVVMWGRSIASSQPFAPTTPGMKRTSVGAYDHALALTDAGKVWSWGSTWYHPVGDTPAGVSSGVKQISDGFGGSFALKDNGTVVGWGNYSAAQTSPVTLTVNLTPQGAVDSGARWWLFDGWETPAYYRSGETLYLTPGTYQFMTNFITGWGANSPSYSAVSVNLTSASTQNVAYDYPVCIIAFFAGSPYRNSISQAFTDTPDGSITPDMGTIKMRDTTIIDDPNLLLDKRLFLKGGCGPTFGGQIGMTRLQGTLTVTLGSLVIEGVVIQ